MKLTLNPLEKDQIQMRPSRKLLPSFSLMSGSMDMDGLDGATKKLLGPFPATAHCFTRPMWPFDFVLSTDTLDSLSLFFLRATRWILCAAARFTHTAHLTCSIHPHHECHAKLTKLRR
jgi:hypothetical protein